AAMSGLFLAILNPAARAQNFVPGGAYDPSIPTIEAVLGKPSGERITPSADVVRYFRALEKAAPDRIKVTPYAKSWQGRELIYVVIGSPQHIATLDGFSADMKVLADPRRTSQPAANAIIARAPGSVWLAHGVHGDEISSADAAMMTAYHLLAAKDDPAVTGILANTLVFIDPVQNPDGRDRFVNGFYDTTGLVPSGSPIAAERVQPWPGGRYNHYLFDMNRDWLSITQPETIGRIQIFQKWFPLVFVDLHEMGSNSTYFFSPEADPYNPDITQSQRNALKLIGRNNARWFDRFGFSYFTREVYDAFYPGYGAAWPLFHGSIGTTYEQASSRGLVARKFDGTDMSYQDTVRHHFTSSIATLETMSANREKLLRDFYAYRASAIEDGRKGAVRSYVIPPQQDQSTADRLAKLLVQHGIEVSRATDTIRACRKTYPAGSYAISLAQPAGRLARTVVEPQVNLDKTFMVEQERRRAKDLEPELYDVTAWSLPLMFNVTTDRCADEATGALAAFTMDTPTPGAFANPDAAYGFLAPWGSTAAARLLASALREGIEVSSADVAFTHEGQSYPSGTLIFRKSATPNLAAKLQRLAADTSASVVGVDNSWITEGPSFGSERVATHKAPRIAIAWDRPVSPTSAGNLRFVVERQLGYPVTPVRVASLGAEELSQFDVLILPDGNYGAALGDGAAIKGWTERGGVLIAIGSASNFVADPKTGLSSIRRENAVRKDEAEEKKDEKTTVPGTEFTSAADLLAAETPIEEAPDASPGALVKAIPDKDHWLAAGLKPSLNVLMTGSDIFTPARRDAGVNVVSFAGPADLVTSGYLWEDTQRQLAYKPFVVVEPKGRGQLIVFTQNPTVRAYLDGLNVLLANAIFRGAAHAKPPR
ncbi:MAG: M14 metallopeptidase family protein, partial [Hyphomonadaceae bacterium]